MVLRVKPTPTLFPTNSLYNPMDSTPLHSLSSVWHPWGSCCCCCCLGISPRAQLLKKSSWLLHLNNSEVLDGRIVVTRALSWRCYPHTENSGLIWCLSSNPSLSIGCYPVRAMWTKVTKEEIKELMIIRVRSTAALFIPSWTACLYKVIFVY